MAYVVLFCKSYLCLGLLSSSTVQDAVLGVEEVLEMSRVEVLQLWRPQLHLWWTRGNMGQKIIYNVYRVGDGAGVGDDQTF